MKVLLALLLISAPSTSLRAAAAVAALKLDMSRPPAVGPWKAYSPPARVRWGLPNGLRVIFISDPRAPLLTLRLAVRGGTALGAERDAGLVEAMAELMTEGTAKRTALELAEAADAAGGAVGAHATPDHVVVEADGLAEKADELLALLKEAALSPTFPEDEVSLRKENMLSELKLNRSEPSWLAGAALARALYAGHPYAVPGPSEASIARIDRGALQRLHRKLFAPQSAVLVAVGPLTAEGFKAKADELFSDWPTTPELPSPPAPAPTPRTAPAVSFVERPASAQSATAFGILAAKEDEADYPALLVANMVVGGSFAARLTTDLREDKGWTYGIYSRLDSRLASGAFIIKGQMRGEVTRKAIDAVLGHLERLRKDPPTPAELEQAKALLAADFVKSLETVEGLAEAVLHDTLRGLPDDHLDTFTARVQAVTAVQARDAARKWMPASGLVVAVVGDPSVAKTLQGIAPLTVVGDDGLPTKK